MILLCGGSPAAALQMGRDLETWMQNLAYICFLVKKNEGVLQRGFKSFSQPAAAEVFVPTVMPIGCLETEEQCAMLYFLTSVQLPWSQSNSLAVEL